MLGKKLKALLAHSGYKQVEFASELGISPSRLSNYLSDKREPDLDTLCKAAHLLGVDLNYFSPHPFCSTNLDTVSAVSLESDIPVSSSSVMIPVYHFKSKKSSSLSYSVSLDSRLAPPGSICYVISPNTFGGIFQRGVTIVTLKTLKSSLTSGSYILTEGRNGSLYRYISGDLFIDLNFSKLISIADPYITCIRHIISPTIDF